MSNFNLPIYQYISQGRSTTEQLNGIQKVLDQGIKFIQIRWKESETIQLIQLGLKVRKLCDAYQALLIINDHWEIQPEINADGVHLGLTDASITQVRVSLGSNVILGGTANTFQDVKQRIAEKADYIGLGPYRFTSTKTKLSPILGLTGYEEILQQLKEEKLAIPTIYAIGGIEEQDISPLQGIGIYGIAASTLFLNQ